MGQQNDGVGSHKQIRKITSIVKPSTRQSIEVSRQTNATSEKSPAEKTRDLLAKAAGIIDHNQIGQAGHHRRIVSLY